MGVGEVASNTENDLKATDAVLVVPCFNEAERLDLAAFEAFARQARGRVGFVFVDDGSTDDTRSLLESLARQVPDAVALKSLDSNQGKAEAVRQGLLTAISYRPTLIGYLDADLATPLSEATRLIDQMLTEPECLMMMGSRVRMAGATIKRRWHRHLAGRLFATAAAWASGLSVYDTQCGMKLLRLSIAPTQVLEQPFTVNWAFDVELMLRLKQAMADPVDTGAGFVVKEVPLSVWTDIGRSSVTPLAGARAFLDLFRLYLRYRR